MSEGLSDRAAALITGTVGLGFSLAYIAYARGIEDSLLADAVGAAGVPVGVGGLMAVCSVALLIKGALARSPAASADAPAPESAAPASSSADIAPVPQHPHRLAALLLSILAAYLVLLPVLGYVVSVGLMVLAVAWFSGARHRLALLCMALCTGPLLWLVFDFTLKVRLPAGVWPRLMAG